MKFPFFSFPFPSFSFSSIFSYFSNSSNRVTVEEIQDSSQSRLKKIHETILFKRELNKLLKDYSVQKTRLVLRMDISSYAKDISINTAIDHMLDLSPEEQVLLKHTNILELIHLNKDKDDIFKEKINFFMLVKTLEHLKEKPEMELLFQEEIKCYELSLSQSMRSLNLNPNEEINDHLELIQDQVKPEFLFNLIASSIQNNFTLPFSWDPQLLLALNVEIQKRLPQLILEIQDSIKFCNTLENLVEKFKHQSKLDYVPETGKISLAYGVNTPFCLTIQSTMPRGENWHNIKQKYIDTKSEIIFHSKTYLKTQITQYKKNYESLLTVLKQIHPCTLNAYIIVQDSLFVYQLLTSPQMNEVIVENAFTGEFHCFIEKMKNTCINIIKTLLPFAREAKKFFGTESFGKENESYIKDILNPQENPYVSYENNLRKKLEEQWNEAEKERLEKEKKLQKKEKIKKNNQPSSSNGQKNDQSILPKIENNNNKSISVPTETKPSRKEEKQKNREQLELQRQESQQEKEENLKKLNLKKNPKPENIISGTTMKLTSIDQAKKIYAIPSREDLNKKILSSLNNNNNCIFNALFDLDQSEITHHNIQTLAKIISELLVKHGYKECAENFLKDIKKHIHPNHGTGQGSVMSIKHKYCIRTYFILSGIIPLDWDLSFDNLQAFSYYEQKMKAWEKRESNNTNK